MGDDCGIRFGGNLVFKIKRPLAAACLAVGLAAVPATAQAGTANSIRGTYTVSGIQYWNQSQVVTSTGRATARTFSGPDSHCVGAGSVAVQARLIRSAGTAEALVASSGTYYSEVTLCPGQYIGWSVSYNGTGSFYSRGISWAWNTGTSNYNAFWAFPSPNQNA